MAVEVKDNTAKVLQSFKTAIGAGLNLIGASATGYAQDNTPIRTGNLVNSADWIVKESEKAVYVGFLKSHNVEYAIFVENGSRNNRAHHMLRRAATEHTKEYGVIMKDALEHGGR